MEKKAMGNRTQILVLALCLAACQAEAQLGNSPLATGGSTNAPSPSGAIPFRLYRGSVIVAEGSLNGISKRNLLIDTGSNPTVLDLAVARKLGLGGQATHLRMMDGSLEGTTGVLSNLMLGPIRARSVPVFIADLSFIKKDLGTRIDAVVGLDILHTNFLIDYDSRRIVFGPVPSLPASVAFETGPPLVTVTMQTESEAIRLLIDTAAGGLLIFRRLGRAEDSGGTSQIANLISLRQNLEQVEISRVRLGDLYRTRQTAYLVHATEESSRDFDGLVAPPALGIRQIAFDFDLQLLSWK
jgi:hypothetical protein